MRVIGVGHVHATRTVVFLQQVEQWASKTVLKIREDSHTDKENDHSSKRSAPIVTSLR